jgi:hypothetical protein
LGDWVLGFSIKCVVPWQPIVSKIVISQKIEHFEEKIENDLHTTLMPAHTCVAFRPEI